MTTQTQTSKANIKATTLRTQPSKAHIATITQQLQTAKARMRVVRVQLQNAKANIKVTTARTQPAKANILATTTQTQSAKAHIVGITQQAQPAKANIKVVTQQTQSAKAYINPPNLKVVQPAAPGLFVQYGNFVLTESNSVVITTPYNAKDDSIFGDWYCEFDVRLPGSSAANTIKDDVVIAALIQNIETQLKIPRQRLLVRFGSSIVRDWNFNSAAQTAFLIYPELRLLRENRRRVSYGLRVRCEFPGNIPNNFFRRESSTRRGTSIRENRTCTITATWTSSPNMSALDNYNQNGDTFFNAYLPKNNPDQYGNAGAWVRADENPVTTNDENSLCTATRVYWECFVGRRDSLARDIDVISGRRTFTASSTWTSTTAGHTALQNYLDGGDAFYKKILPAPVNNGAWVLVDEEPAYNDQNGVLVTTRTYHEVVNGLREFKVEVTSDAANLRTTVVSGTYYQTNLAAYTNYTANIDTLVANTLNGLTPPMTRFESVSVPKYEGYDTTGKRYFFRWTLREIAYNQGPTADDPDITVNTLDIQGTIPRDPQSIPQAVPITRLQTIRARFAGVVNYKKNQDPASLWASRIRGFTLNAITTKLGNTSLVVDVVDEKVDVGLHGNTFAGTMVLVVTGGSTLSMRVEQTLIQIPSRDFAMRADGTDLSGFPYRAPADQILFRTAVYEYVLGSAEPDPFAATISGFGMVATGMTAQASIDAQNAVGEITQPGWFIDRRAPTPYSKKVLPTTRGLGFNTVTVVVVETWRLLNAVEPGTSIP